MFIIISSGNKLYPIGKVAVDTVQNLKPVLKEKMSLYAPSPIEDSSESDFVWDISSNYSEWFTDDSNGIENNSPNIGQNHHNNSSVRDVNGTNNVVLQRIIKTVSVNSNQGREEDETTVPKSNFDSSQHFAMSNATNTTDFVGQLIVPLSKHKLKQHFCVFCKTLQTKISRHFFLKHKSEHRVKMAMKLSKKSRERLKIIGDLRKEGDFLHNTSKDDNTGTLIVSRRQQKYANHNADDYVCCAKCKGFYSKFVARHHIRNCLKPKNSRKNFIEGRKLTQFVHPIASNEMKSKVFPVLRNDKITQAVRYDELIITYGNGLLEKRGESNYHDPIRANLRLLGRFKLELMRLEPAISALKNIFTSSLIDKAIEAFCKTAKWDDSKQSFLTPAVASNLSKLIKKCAQLQRREFLKNQKEDMVPLLDEFAVLWAEKTSMFINKVFPKYLKNQKDIVRFDFSRNKSSHEDADSNLYSTKINGCGYKTNKHFEISFQNQLSTTAQEQTSESSSDTSESFSDSSSYTSEYSIEKYENDTRHKKPCSKSPFGKERSFRLTERNNIELGDSLSIQSKGQETALSKNQDNFIKEQRSSKAGSDKENMPNSVNFENLIVPVSQNKSKQHFCLFCKTLQCKISRHLFLKHKCEKLVKIAMKLPKHSMERLKIIDQLRKEGDFLHNTSKEENTGTLIVSRRQQRYAKRNAGDYICCANCKGFYTKSTGGDHLRKCLAKKSYKSNSRAGRMSTRGSDNANVSNKENVNIEEARTSSKYKSVLN